MAITIEKSEEQLEFEADQWKGYKKERQEKRWQNEKQSLDLLRKNGIHFECLSESVGHYRVGQFDFWPTTGKFINRLTKEAGRGVFKLIMLLDGTDTRFCGAHSGSSSFDEVIGCNDCSFYLKD